MNNSNIDNTKLNCCEITKDFKSRITSELENYKTNSREWKDRFNREMHYLMTQYSFQKNKTGKDPCLKCFSFLDSISTGEEINDKEFFYHELKNKKTEAKSGDFDYSKTWIWEVNGCPDDCSLCPLRMDKIDQDESSAYRERFQWTSNDDIIRLNCPLCHNYWLVLGKIPFDLYKDAGKNKYVLPCFDCEDRKY